MDKDFYERKMGTRFDRFDHDGDGSSPGPNLYVRARRS